MPRFGLKKAGPQVHRLTSPCWSCGFCTCTTWPAWDPLRSRIDGQRRTARRCHSGWGRCHRWRASPFSPCRLSGGLASGIIGFRGRFRTSFGTTRHHVLPACFCYDFSLVVFYTRLGYERFSQHKIGMTCDESVSLWSLTALGIVSGHLAEAFRISRAKR